jgi:hypothetical protein
MRFMLKCRIPNETANQAIMDGTLFPKLQGFIQRIRPEAVYYSLADGQRTIFFVLNVDSPEKWPFTLEPLWHDVKADITVWPVFTPDEMQHAAPDIEQFIQSRKKAR